MPSHITVTPSDATWVVRVDGAILEESRRAIELREGSYPPVIYIPRDDVAIPDGARRVERAVLIGRLFVVLRCHGFADHDDPRWAHTELRGPAEPVGAQAGDIAVADHGTRLVLAVHAGVTFVVYD